jgi:hypothetical protein
MKTDKPINPFIKARKSGVPIVAIESADPAATIVKCQQALNGKHDVTPLLTWDLVRGLQAKNKAGAAVLSHFSDEALTMPQVCLSKLVEKVDLLQVPSEDDPDHKIPAIVFMVHANRWIEDTECMQAVWNCRLAFEPKGINLVLLGPSFKLPAELKNDIVLISEPLPDHEELGGILDKIASDAELKEEQIGEREIVVDTMSGTSAFGARQILAMSITREGVDQDQLWERKRKMIEQCPGLAVWKGGSTFDDLGGLDNLKDFLSRVLTSGQTPVRAIGFIDEIEKGLAGSSGDTSGTSQDQLQVFLKVMQDFNIPGVILVGHVGTGKSEIAKGAGNVAKCPVISIDTGAMKDSLVGGSELRIRQAMEVFKAVSQGKGLFIATCNKISSLPPELRRRFTLGTFFVDLPTQAERDLIWPIWIERFKLTRKQALPDCDGWTGAEIRACCDVAFRTGLPLREASKFVVPVVKSAPEAVEALRKLASNRFINAAKPGVYVYQDKSADVQETTGRKISRE